MMIVGLPCTGWPLKSVILALIGFGTVGRASPLAVPDPILEALGQPEGPLVASAESEHFLKNLAFTTAPFGKRRVVLVMGGGFTPVSSAILRTVLRVSPPRVLFRSARL